MFKFIERAMREHRLKSTPYSVKLNAVSKSVENIIRENPDALMPIITRIGIVMNYILNKRLVNYYFANRGLIPSLCADLKCL